MRFVSAAALATVAMVPAIAGQHDVTPLDADSTAWNRPVAPFAIADGLFYVGASDVTAFVFRTPAGIILLDTGLYQTGEQIVANLKTLGMDVRDVKIIITSHAHYDHVGAVAAIRRLSGAKLVVSAADAPAMAAGGRGDFAYGDRFPFPAARADRVIRDGETVSLGGTTLRAHLTAGHTRGCTTWSTRVTVAGRPRDALFVCSLSAPGYDLTDTRKYPNIVRDYRASFARAAGLPCEVFLGGHGQMFDLTAKRARIAAGDSAAFVDPRGCRNYVDKARAGFERQLARQRADRRQKNSLRTESRIVRPSGSSRSG